jgi:sporulation protein YlmC with PRC-barrel domain
MKRSTLASSVAGLFCLGFAAPVLAAQPAATGTVSQSSSSEKNVASVKPAEKCLNDLRAFDGQMEQDGYWLGGSNYSYGYPMDGFGYGAGFGNGYGYPIGPTGDRPAAAGAGTPPATTTTGYQNARPGYELRTLIAAADILARQGQQQPCEDVVATTRNIYKVYVADMRSGKVPVADAQGWRQQQIAAAQPVTGTNTAFRSDELVGTEVRGPQNEALGSVDDLVMSPKAGKIAYVVIARGGIFGIDEKFVPVPWEDFKIAPNVKLLVLDATKDTLEKAPQASKDQFTTPGHFDQLSQKVNDYWKMHLSDKGKS